MGVVEVQREGKTLDLKLEVEAGPLKEINQMLSWSLKQARDVYEVFRQKAGGRHTLLDLDGFVRVVPLRKKSAGMVFSALAGELGGGLTRVRGIVLAAVHGDRGGFQPLPLQVLYSIFDFDNSGYIETREIVVMFKSFVIANQKMRGGVLPDPLFLDRFALASFARSDLNSETTINFHTLLSWVENNPLAMSIFDYFEPPDLKIRQNYQVFRKFKPYNGRPFIESILEYHQAYNSLSHLKAIFSRDGKQHREKGSATSHQAKGLSQLFNPKKKDKLSRQIGAQERPFTQGNRAMNLSRLRSRGTKGKPQSVGQGRSRQVQVMKPTSGQCHTRSSLGLSPDKFQSLLQDLPMQLFQAGRSLMERKEKQILIINGAALTRRQIFRVKDYFNQLCGRDKQIKIEQFSRVLSGSLLNGHSNSLFAFLDSRRRGEVTFEDFILKIYPSLSEKQLEIIRSWVQQHELYIIAEKKEVRQSNFRKKRILPESCVQTLKQLFRNFDEGNKGFLSYSDLRRVYRAYNPREVEELILKYGKGPEHGLTLEEFAACIIPNDFQMSL